MNKRVVGWVLSASILTILLAMYSWMPMNIPALVPGHTEDAHEKPPLQGPRNSTLGFQKIYYISMPQRTDRQDMMSLIGGYLNLELTRVDGVNGSTVPPKAYPFDIKNPPQPPSGHSLPRPAAVGCWRAHANIWSHMVSTGVSSALILEDDADFSVGIRDIMEGVSSQLQNVMGARNEEPYGIVDGDSWDILTIGHCGYRIPDEKSNPKASKQIRVWADPYAPESTRFSGYTPDASSQRLRLLAPSQGSACTQGYAVTREGAMNLLYNIGGPGHVLDMAMDLVIWEQLAKGVVKGFLSVPDIVAQWKVQDWRDTDIQLDSEEALKNAKGGSGADIVGSVREEIKSIFGNRNVWEEIENGEETENGEEATRDRRRRNMGKK